MKKTLALSLVLALQIASVNFLFAGANNDTTKIKPTDFQKSCFYSAKQEIEDMLSGKTPLNYERAVFVTENAFYDNEVYFENYQYILDKYTTIIKQLYASEYNEKSQNLKPTLLETEDIKRKKYANAVANWAIYRYIADTTKIINNNSISIYLPFKYSNKDPFATNNWSNSQIFSLINPYSRSGNCYALASLFKILSLRLNSDANICTAPNHVFIQHKDNNGIQYNVELASNAFPGTGSLQTITYTTNEAIRSGIALRTLDLKQSVAICLVYLAKSYENKFNIKDDAFLLSCANLAIKNDSLNLNAMLLKAEVLEERIIKKSKTIAQLQTDKEFLQYQKFIAKLYQLGYREMPLEMKNILVSTIRKDTVPLIIKDHTPQPFASIGVKTTRYATLSNGLFEEVHETKPIEKFNRTVFDTKTKKVKTFENPDALYNNYNFDPVVFALSVDPLAAKYPSLSPYAFCANNPIIYVDKDGREIEGVIVKDGKYTYTDAALKNGTDKYIQARTQTATGIEKIGALISSKETYRISVTDKVILMPTADGRYGIAGGGADASTNSLIVGLNEARFATVSDVQLQNAVTVDAKGNLVPLSISRDNLDNPLVDPNNDYTKTYQKAYEESGAAAFDNNAANTPKTTAEKINAFGAHEETHLTKKNIKMQEAGNVYGSEKAAFKEEIKERKEYQETVPK